MTWRETERWNAKGNKREGSKEYRVVTTTKGNKRINEVLFRLCAADKAY